MKLRDVVESGLLPTPTTDERDTKYAQGGTNLRAADANATDAMRSRTRQDNRQGEPRQPNQKMPFANWEDFLQPAPLFVEEMMGFPRNWTALPFQSGDEKASKPTGTPSCPK